MKTSTRIGTLLLSGVALVLVLGPATLLSQKSPAIQATHVNPDVLSLVCAPKATTAQPAATLHITGGQDPQLRESFSQGDFVTLDAGANQGLQIGQEFVVRRLLAPKGAPMAAGTPGTTHTAGWVRVYALDDDMALATITYNCDAMRVGDYLEPLALPTPLKAEPTRGKPERDYARVILGRERRVEMGAGDYLVIDRGSAQGITPGAQFVVYRWKKNAPKNFLSAIAEAVAVEAQDSTATLRLTSTRDAVAVNDLVALRK